MSVATVVSAANGTWPVTASTSVEGERVDVGLAVDGQAPGLLGRGVAGGAEHDAGGLGPRRLGEGAGQAEVGDAQPAVLAEQQVGGLDVAVDEAAAVGVVEAAGRLEADEQRLRRRQLPAAVEHRAQAAAAEVLEHEVRRGVDASPSSPQSYTAMTFGWLRAAAAWASARKRLRNAASSASDGCRTLTATRRCSCTSSATNTVADAPVPTGARSR